MADVTTVDRKPRKILDCVTMDKRIQLSAKMLPSISDCEELFSVFRPWPELRKARRYGASR
jgi:hypothetical protein